MTKEKEDDADEEEEVDENSVLPLARSLAPRTADRTSTLERPSAASHLEKATLRLLLPLVWLLCMQDNKHIQPPD